MRETITIPAPRAVVDQAVIVRNYRKRPADYERGTVSVTEFRMYGANHPLADQIGSWTYQVRLNRNPNICLSVGDADVYSIDCSTVDVTAIPEAK